jgi:adenylate cyclase
MAFMLVTLVPLSIATYGSVNKAEVELQSSINEGLETEAKQIISYFEHQYFDSWNHNMQLLVELIKQQPNLDVSSLNAMVNVFLQENNGLIMAQLKLPNTPESLKFFKQTVFSNDSLKAKLIRQTNSTIGESSQDIFLDGLFTDKNVLYVNTSFTFPWTTTANASLGMTFKVEQIETYLHEEFIKGKSEYYIVDANLNTIFRSPNAIFEKDEQINFPFISDLAELMTSENNIRKVEPFEYNNENYVGFFTNFPRLKWGIIIVDNASNAYALVDNMKADIIFWILLAIAFCVVFSIIFSRTFTKSILILTDVAKKVGQGNLDQKFEVKSNDELGLLAKTLEEMIKQLKERVNMMRFISQSTATMIAETDNVQNIVQRKTITSFFSDIRGFTAFSEDKEPEEVIRMLNTYLSIQAKIIKEHGGEIDKFVGDEIFAIFFGDSHETRAIKAAKDIQQQLEIVRQTERQKIHVGIGIHSGVTVMGTIGFGERMDHTVLGSAVNLAARLCQHSAADEILVSESLHKSTQTDFQFEMGDKLEVKGFTHPVQAYKIKDSKHA